MRPSVMTSPRFVSTDRRAELTKTENAQPGIFLVSWVAFELLERRCPGLEFDATAGLVARRVHRAGRRGRDQFRGRVARGARARTFHAGSVRGQRRAAWRQSSAWTKRRRARSARSGSGTGQPELPRPDRHFRSERTNISAGLRTGESAGAKRALPLTVAGAYHSPLMDRAQPKLRERAQVGPHLRAQSSGHLERHRATSRRAGRHPRAAGGASYIASVRWEDSMRYLSGAGRSRGSSNSDRAPR